MVRFALICLLIFLPRGVRAEQSCGPQDYTSETPPDVGCPGPGEDALVPDLDPPESVPVRSGQVVTAPWDGALVHRDRLVYLGLRIRALRRLRWLDTLQLTQRCLIQTEHAEDVADIREDLLRAQAADAERRATRADRQAQRAEAWWNSVWFGLVLGVVGAGLLVVLVAYVVTVI